MDYYEKIIILVSLVFISIYFCFYFNFQQILLNIIGKSSTNEKFISYLAQPHKLFKHKGKIYLLNTQSIFELNKNPLVFHTFEDYQKYILSLEKEIKEKVSVKIGNTNKSLPDIKKEDIPDLELKKSKKINEIDANNPYYKNYMCHRQTAYCNIDTDFEKDKDKTPFFDSIYEPDSLKKFRDKVCRKKILSDEQCELIKTFEDNKKKLNQVCYSQDMYDPEFKEVFDPLCQKHKFIQNNNRYLKSFCQSNSNYYDHCLHDDFIREEILSSLTPLKKNID